MATRWTAAGVSALMQFYGPLRSFFAEGGTGQQAWGFLTDVGGEDWRQGLQPTIFDMNEIRDRAVQSVNAQSAFAAADLGQEFERGMWSWAPWSDQGISGNPFESYQARFSVTTTTLGPDEPIFMQFPLDQPLDGLTKEQIIDKLTELGQEAIDSDSPRVLAQLDGRLGGTIVDISDIEIMRV